MRREVLVDGDEGYDAARTVGNADVDRRPAVIARCTSVADVSAAVRLAVGQELALAVRGGASLLGDLLTATLREGLSLEDLTDEAVVPVAREPSTDAPRPPGARSGGRSAFARVSRSAAPASAG